MAKTKKPTPMELAKRARRAFGLDSVPEVCPYATPAGLQLPERASMLSKKKIKQIFVFAIANQLPLYVADMLNWLRDHPEAAMSLAEARQRAGRIRARSTLFNYPSIASAWPLAERVPELPIGFHDAARTLPRTQRSALLKRVLAENWSVRKCKVSVEEAIAQALKTPLPAELKEEMDELDRTVKFRDFKSARETAASVIAMLDRMVDDPGENP